MPIASYSTLEAPLVALAALGLIVLICRWVFSTDHRSPARRPAGPRDLGLLEPVATVRTREDAAMLRDVLRAAGIRTSITPEEAGFVVLAFPEDAGRARALVRS